MSKIEVVFNMTAKRVKEDLDSGRTGQVESEDQTKIEFYGYNSKKGPQKIVLTPLTPKRVGEYGVEFRIDKVCDATNTLLRLPIGERSRN